jgi:hypothetical protein
MKIYCNFMCCHAKLNLDNLNSIIKNLYEFSNLVCGKILNLFTMNCYHLPCPMMPHENCFIAPFISNWTLGWGNRWQVTVNGCFFHQQILYDDVRNAALCRENLWMSEGYACWNFKGKTQFKTSEYFPLLPTAISAKCLSINYHEMSCLTDIILTCVH